MLRFAPRYGIISPALVRPSRLPRPQAGNDNSVPVAELIADERVRAALRLFAVHGLAAGERAARAAANANAEGDADQAAWWHDISDLLGQRRAP
jgi:hypothetical protein